MMKIHLIPLRLHFTKLIFLESRLCHRRLEYLLPQYVGVISYWKAACWIYH